MSMPTTRRGFLAATAGTTLAAKPPMRSYSANDKIQFALVGTGGMGMSDATSAVAVPGNVFIAAADVYDGRLLRAKEKWGNQLFTTRDYREVLARPDVDAVIIATPDHWHSRIAIDALEAGKHVYCEKPMVHQVEQGMPVVQAARKSGRVFQVGSQYVSSLIYQKTRELLAAGAIGKLNMVEAWLDRDSAIGAWQYSIPPDASPDNIDWDRFLGSAPKRPFEPIRLFRWRNYRDYGTAVAGDLFVHLLSGLHYSTGALGPSRVFATGGLRYWKDGRDVPDVMLAMMDYPDFSLALRVNFKSGVYDQLGFRFVGSEGTLMAGNSVRISKSPRETEPGYTIDTFPKAVQDAFLKQYRAEYPVIPPSVSTMPEQAQTVFSVPAGYDAHREHHKVFWAAVRGNQPVIEDAVFGFRAAGPALLSNTSYFEERICRWDPQSMTEIKS